MRKEGLVLKLSLYSKHTFYTQRASFRWLLSEEWPNSGNHNQIPCLQLLARTVCVPLRKDTAPKWTSGSGGRGEGGSVAQMQQLSPLALPI